MRICIYGAGAIGGYLAAGLSTVDGVELSLVARGPHLAKIQQSGLKLPVTVDMVLHQGATVPAEMATIVQSIWKPLGINTLARLPGGWGVVLDDIAGGLLVNAILRLLPLS